MERHVFSGHRGAGCGWRERDRDDIAGGSAGSGAVDGHAIHGDVPVFDPQLDLRASRRVDVGKMPAKHEVEPNACVAPIGREDASGRIAWRHAHNLSV
jgi:hypothetical protein